MKTKRIRVSEEVWNEIAKQGKRGETEEDALRRVFNLCPKDPPGEIRSRIATERMTVKVIADHKLLVEFENGPYTIWELPARNDKAAIELVRNDAVNFAERQGATEGQVNAVRKTLTEHGRYVQGPRW